MSVTIYDVARTAGVSPKTVARILNGASLRSKSVEKVLKVAAQLGYVKNSSAARLRRQRDRSIGVVVPSITNPFYSLFAETFFYEAHARGFQMILEHSFGEVQMEARCLRSFLEYDVAGVVFNVAEEYKPTIFDEWLPLYHSRRIPLIIAGAEAGKLPTWTILLENVLGLKSLVAHLVSRGHRQIAFILGNVPSLGHRERLEGFVSGMAEQNLPVMPDWVLRGVPTAESGYQLTKDLLRNLPKPTAIITSNDIMALGAIRAAHEWNLAVPGDVAIAGFDDIPYAQYNYPSLTTLQQPQQQIAADCIALIQRCMESDHLPKPAPLIYTPKLVVREST